MSRSSQNSTGKRTRDADFPVSEGPSSSSDTSSVDALSPELSTTWANRSATPLESGVLVLRDSANKAQPISETFVLNIIISHVDPAEVTLWSQYVQSAFEAAQQNAARAGTKSSSMSRHVSMSAQELAEKYAASA